MKESSLSSSSDKIACSSRSGKSEGSGKSGHSWPSGSPTAALVLRVNTVEKWLNEVAFWVSILWGWIYDSRYCLLRAHKNRRALVLFIGGPPWGLILLYFRILQTREFSTSCICGFYSRRNSVYLTGVMLRSYIQDHRILSDYFLMVVMCIWYIGTDLA